jgi:hypothetical protein
VDAAIEGLIPVAPVGGIRQRRAGRGQPVRAGVAAELSTVLAVCGRLPAQEAPAPRRTIRRSSQPFMHNVRGYRPLPASR